MSPEALPLSQTWTLREWRYEEEPDRRFRVCAQYVERLWLPALGPTALLLLRLLAELLDENGDGHVVESAFLARALGLGSSHGERSSLARATRRLDRFNLARWEGESLLIRVEIPPVSTRDLGRLPQALQARHAQAMGGTAP